MESVHPFIGDAVRLAVARQTKRHMCEDKLLPKTLCALEFLINNANRRKKVCYEDVSLHCGMGNPQWANITFDPINLVALKANHDPRFPYQDVPDLSAIVSRKGKNDVGEGFYINHPEAKGKAERTKLVSNERDRVFAWKHWPEYASFLKITPLPVLAPPRKELIDFDKASRSSQGKSPEHQKMQDSILADPHSVEAALRGEVIRNESECEYLFWSQDRLDVVIKTTEEWVGFEVKPLSASHNELRKGIYQAYKYAALMKADVLDHGDVKPCRCLLVVQGKLDNQLLRLAQTLNVQVKERYQPK